MNRAVTKVPCQVVCQNPVYDEYCQTLFNQPWLQDREFADESLADRFLPQIEQMRLQQYYFARQSLLEYVLQDRFPIY